ncbi:MAG: hypothetical protein H5T64_03430 [Chloroflexi bacterium]|nr:hypothetical protein [Chloroflexota bacterium]
MTIANWRDVALVVLALEVAGLGLGIGAILYVTLREYRHFKPRLKPLLLILHIRVYEATAAVQRICRLLVRPFVVVGALWAGSKRGLKRWLSAKR